MINYEIGDCLELFKNIEDNSIDLIVTDPPYNIGKDHWDSWETVNEYVEWLGSVFSECQRVLKDTGSFYFFHNDFMQIVEIQNWINKNTDFVFGSLITWNKIHEDFKNSGFVHQRLSIDMQRKYYNGFTEYCMFYTFQDSDGYKKIKWDCDNFVPLRQYFEEFHKSLGMTKKEIIEKVGQQADHCFRYNSSQWDMPTEETYIELCKLSDKHKFKNYEELRTQYEELKYTFNVQNVKVDLRSNSNVWLYPPAEKQGHITPKPVELIKNIILHSSNENDLVLDPFLGSGTTAVACKELNRNFIGFEKEEEYGEIIKERLKEGMLTDFF